MDEFFNYKRALQQALSDFNNRCGGPGGTPTPGYGKCPKESEENQNQQNACDAACQQAISNSGAAATSVTILWILYSILFGS